MDLFPREILSEIILFLPSRRDLQSLKCTNRFFCNLISNDRIVKISKYMGSKSFAQNNQNKWTWIYPLLRDLSNYVVAGSQALQIFHDLNWLDSDFDIFFYDQEPEKFITQAFNLFQRVCQNNEQWSWSWEMKPYKSGIDFKYFDTLKLEDVKSREDVFLIRLSGVPIEAKVVIPFQLYPSNKWDKSHMRKIDLVYTKYKYPDEIMNDFDLPFCGIGFEVDMKGDIVHFLKSEEENYQAARTKEGNIYLPIYVTSPNDLHIRIVMNYISLQNSDHSLKIDNKFILEKRINKYIDRGFKIKRIYPEGNPEFHKRRTIAEKEENRRKYVMNYTL